MRNRTCIPGLRWIAGDETLGPDAFINFAGFPCSSLPWRSDPMKCRKLSPSERMHVAVGRYFPPFAVQFWIEGESRFSHKELGDAMKLAAAVNPAICWKRRGAWWVEGDCPRIREGSCLDSAKRDPLDLETHPCELVVLPGGLLFRSSHALMDGGGALFWAEEFFRALRSEPLQGTDTLISDREYLFRNGKLGRPEMRLEHPSPFSGGNGFGWVEKSAPSGDHAFVAKAIAGACRENGGTFMVPVDLRRIENIRTTTNLTNLLFLKVEAGTSWDEIHRSLLGWLESGGALLRNRREWMMGLLMFPVVGRVLRNFHRFAISRNRHSASGLVSHLGNVKLADFSAAPFVAKRIRPIPSDVPGVGFSLVSLNHQEGLEIALSVPGQVDEAVEEWIEELCGKSEISGPVMAIEEDLYDRFLGVVERQPDAPAVIHGNERLSFRELEQRAAAFHGAIRERGILAGERVAVLLPHSTGLLVALLGLIRGGNPFVPLDPAWPEARIQKVVADSGARLVIREDLPGSSTFPPPERTPLAYLMYTSGSTGEPKGVKVSRKSFLNFLLWGEHAFEGRMTSPLFCSIAFDLTLTSVFVPWMTGGAVWIPLDRELGGAVREILTSPVDTITLTPSHLRLFIENGFQDSTIRRLIVGGESFPAALAKQVLEQRDMEIINLYGPTEATVGCVIHQYDPEKDFEPTVPIGLPILNTRAVLRNGELLVGGVCLAEGYEGRPAFGELYSTGDLVTWEGGKLHCHGRRDDQVKVRGQRIEPAEVEAAILESGLVSECVVRAEKNKLIAFLVWKGEEEVGLLREHLGRELPRAWIPDFYHALDALPLSASGKVDGKALVMRFPVVETDVAHTPMETELLEMAAGIMDVSMQQISKDRALHEMGFDSLQMLLLLTRSSRRFKPETCNLGFLGPDFFRTPTIAALARALED